MQAYLSDKLAWHMECTVWIKCAWTTFIYFTCVYHQPHTVKCQIHNCASKVVTNYRRCWKLTCEHPSMTCTQILPVTYQLEKQLTIVNIHAKGDFDRWWFALCLQLLWLGWRMPIGHFTEGQLPADPWIYAWEHDDKIARDGMDLARTRIATYTVSIINWAWSPSVIHLRPRSWGPPME